MWGDIIPTAFAIRMQRTLLATVPPPASDSAQTGTATKAAREDHSHVARVKRATKTLDANGEATWTFDTAFASVPVITALFEEAADVQPIALKVKAVSATAVTVKAYRGQTLPASLTLLTALISFNIFGGGSLTGVKVHLYAAEAT